MVGDVRSLNDLDEEQLSGVYQTPTLPWLRLNFVTTVDGAITGDDGLSKSINNAADQRVFAHLRGMADYILVGAGTVRAEGYRPNPKPLVLVSRSGAVPPTLREGPLDQVWMATGASAPHLPETSSLLGDRCLVLGDDGPNLASLISEMHARGYEHALCEGGPELAHDLLAAKLVDELCLTVVPRIAGGNPRRLVRGGELDTNLELAGMLQADSTLLQRWLVVRD